MNYLFRWSLIYIGAVLLLSLTLAGTARGSSADLIGRWTAGNKLLTANAHSLAYEFRPDGTYSFTGWRKSMLYNCTTILMSQEIGTYIVNGLSVSLQPDTNPHKLTNTCATPAEREISGNLATRTYRFKVAKSPKARKLELLTPEGRLTFAAIQ